jgi:hypothetical protein
MFLHFDYDTENSEPGTGAVLLVLMVTSLCLQ